MKTSSRVSRICIGCATAIVASLGYNPAVHAVVKISSKATENMTCSGGVCTPTAQNAVLNVGDLAGMLAGGDVKVISDSAAQDIEVHDALSWTSTHRLTLDSYHSIAFDKPLTVAGTGALTIKTDDGGSGGDFSFFGRGSIKFWDTNSSLVINEHQHELLQNIRDFQRELRRDDGTGRYFALSKNWNLSRKLYTEPPISKEFNGTLEGLGNSISHLAIHDSTSNSNVGLFPGLDLAATVRDIDIQAADVTGDSSGQRVGALVGGSSAALVQGVHVTGQISANGSGSTVGGLIGVNGGVVVGCKSEAAISAGQSVLAGGLIGWNVFDEGPSKVSQSYSTGKVSNAGIAGGGLIGKASQGGTLSDNFSVSQVTGVNAAPIGGLIGLRSADGGAAPVLATAYSTGAVSSGTGAPVGGSIGRDDVAGSGIGNDYWDLDTSGVSNPAQGAGNVQNDPGITGLTDAQLKSGLPAGFDPMVWAQKATVNNGYPYLIANPPN